MLKLASVMFFFPLTVLAALYVTSPANDTVFRPGKAHASIIEWIDNSAEPPANRLGKMRIELLLAKTVITTLGKDIPSSNRDFKTYMPWGIGPDSSNYAIVFIPPLPFLPIYSARFTISNHTGTHSSRPDTHNSTSVVPLPHQANTTSEPVYVASSSAISPKSTAAFSPGKEKIGTTQNGSHRMRATGSVHFTALYVLWPAFVGMALAS